MHWTERRRAVVRIGEELQRRDWTLYGYTPDRSEPMTDYYAPAHWDGVATKDGAVACVDVDAYTARRAGQEAVVGRWPTFRANPQGKTWHVERDGRILGSGMGLRKCASYDQAESDPAVACICDRIELLAFPSRRVQLHPAVCEQVTIAAGIAEGDIPFTVYEEGDWTWIAFGTKPSADLRGRLKRAGGRWRRQRGAWSFKYTGVDLAALGLSEQSTVDLAAGTAQQDANTAALLAPGGGSAQQDAVGHRPARGSASEASPAQAVASAQQDAGDYRLTALACPACGLDFHGLAGSRAAVPAPARCPRCGTSTENPHDQADEPDPASPAPPTADDSRAGHTPPHQLAPTWPVAPREPTIASGNATRHTPPPRIAAQLTLTSSGQLSMFEP